MAAAAVVLTVVEKMIKQRRVQILKRVRQMDAPVARVVVQVAALTVLLAALQ
jgi:hypothetical protein